jgi:hypothetical protein
MPDRAPSLGAIFAGRGRTPILAGLFCTSTASRAPTMQRDDPSALGELFGKRAGLWQLRFKHGRGMRIAAVARRRESRPDLLNRQLRDPRIAAPRKSFTAFRINTLKARTGALPSSITDRKLASKANFCSRPSFLGGIPGNLLLRQINQSA